MKLNELKETEHKEVASKKTEDTTAVLSDKKKEVIKKVSSFLQIENPFDKDGCSILKLFNGMDLFLIANEDSVYFSVALASMPSKKDAFFKLLERALLLNRFQLETKEGAISLSYGEEALIYCATLEMENTDELTFRNFLVNLGEVALNIRKQLIL